MDTTNPITSQPIILAVDDTPANLQLLVSELSIAGYQVRPANSGAAALKLVERIIPDLIILDIRMPKMDGYEVCRRLKSRPETRDIPVIFLSALENSADIVKAFEVGGVDYVQKPFIKEELLARIGTHLSIRDLQLTLEERIEQRTKELQTHRDRLAELVEERTTALQASERKYRAIVEDQTEFIVRYLPDTTRTFVNQNYCQQMGKPSVELVGSRILDELSEQGQNRFKQKMSQLTIENPTATDEFLDPTSDDRIRWEQWTDRAIFDEAGNIIEYQSIGRDITERKDAEKAMEKAHNMLVMAEEVGAVGSWEWDVQTNTVSYSDNALELYGIKPEEYDGEMESVFAVFHPEDRVVVQKRLGESVASKKPSELEYRVIKPDGEIRSIKATSEMFFDEQGDVIRLVGHIQDITERKKVEEALKERTRELERFNKIMVNREMRIIEMKTKINELYTELGRETPYPPIWEDDPDR